MNVTHHSHFMSLALAHAEQGRLTVSPNPMVGCVIVKENHIVGQGFHAFAGHPHAEVVALRDAGIHAQGATAYVTLEPCCHHGRTPPCTDALIAAGIQKMYVACLDPNPLMSGKGVAALRAAGIEVEVGLCEALAVALNEIFFHYIKTRRPFVIVKWAMSLDGKTNVNPQDNRQISSSESQSHTHQIRQQMDAILIGANTLLQDNPMLTARVSTQTLAKQPLRVVLTGQRSIPADLKIIDGSLPGKTLLVTSDEDNKRFEDFQNASVEISVLPKNAEGKICLHALLVELGKRE